MYMIYPPLPYSSNLVEGNALGLFVAVGNTGGGPLGGAGGVAQLDDGVQDAEPLAAVVGALLKRLEPAAALLELVAEDALPAVPHGQEQVQHVVRAAHLLPLEALGALGHGLGRVQADLLLEGKGVDGRQRGVHRVAAALGGAVAEGDQGAEGAQDAGGHVGDGERGQDGLVSGQLQRAASDVGGTRSGVGNLLPAGALSVVTVGTVAVLRDVDNATTALASHCEDVVDTETELGHLVETETLDEDIAVLDQVLQDGGILGLAQVNTNGALASVEGELHDVDVRQVRRVDADDVGAEAGQHGANLGSGNDTGHLNNLDTGQGTLVAGVQGRESDGSSGDGLGLGLHVDKWVSSQRLAHLALIPLLGAEADAAAETVEKVVELELLGGKLASVLGNELGSLLVGLDGGLGVDADRSENAGSVHGSVERVPDIGVGGRVETSGAVSQRSGSPALLKVGNDLLELALLREGDDILASNKGGGDAAEPEGGVSCVDGDLAVVVLNSSNGKDLVGHNTGHGV